MAFMNSKRGSFLSKLEIEEMGFRQFGSNVFISKWARIYGANNISLGSNVRIDDFCVISVGAISCIGDYVHFGVSTSILCPQGFEVGDFSGVSPGSRLFGSSDDFTEGHLMHSLVPLEFRKVTESRIFLGKFSQVGANSTVLPNSSLEEGAVLGANSMLKSPTKAWTVYAGVPAKKIGVRKVIKSVPS